MNPSEDF
ncbi:hypothetical protein LINPERPRIM_LOCUS30953 [Linum perenne]